MTRHYELHVKLDRNWYWVDSYRSHKDALYAVKQRSGTERYPMRVVRIVKTTVFEEKK